MKASEVVHKIEFFVSGAITGTAISTGFLIGVHAVLVCAICGFMLATPLELLRNALKEGEKNASDKV